MAEANYCSAGEGNADGPSVAVCVKARTQETGKGEAMSTFKIGDRARLIFAINDKSVIGKQVTILSELVPTILGPLGYRIEIDGYGKKNIFGNSTVCLPEWLSPILPSPTLSEMTYADLMLSFSDGVAA